MKLYTDFWEDSFKVIQRYIRKNEIEFPVPIHLFADGNSGVDGLIINPFEKIEFSADKSKMNRMFDVIGIPHPKTYYSYPNRFQRIPRFITRLIRKNRFIRKRRFSSGGNGKKIFFNFPRFDPEDYYLQEFWKHPTHVRIYYLDGNPFVWCALTGGKGEIRNYKFGWKYVPLNEVDPISTSSCFDCEFNAWAKEIQNMTGLNFFAFDIAMRFDEYKILEINAMPDIRRFRVEPFVTELVKYAERYTSEGDVQ